MKTNRKCLLCNHTHLDLIIDFGQVALAGGFLMPEFFKKEKKYPLEVYFCESCYGLQVGKSIHPKILFKNYFYYSSAIKTLRDHYFEYAKEIYDRFDLQHNKKVIIEIGCNDGVLLKPLADLGVQKLIGVDPASNVVEKIDDYRIKIENDFFGEKLAKKIKEKYGNADIIMANNVFAHIEDIQGVVKGVASLLNQHGVFICEVHYIAHLIDELQYDFFYHEHLFYYSFLSLEKLFVRFGLEIFDIKPISIHGGSLRYYVRKQEANNLFPVTSKVKEIKNKEYKKGYHILTTYMDYALNIQKAKFELMEIISNLKRKGKVIYGYGASGRANTVIQYCGLDNNYLDCIIDDAPAKQGFYTPGSHIPIYSKEFLNSNSPDYIILFAWSFFNEIIKKNHKFLKIGGYIIVPLPEVKIYGYINDDIKEIKLKDNDFLS